ncbi:hypothetical protein K435DRAFT_440079 [Dendrothele bispora CBS 962.96]|uniref:Uncharacterized protein n=1 Tax=Dendrothele bispora (strain CBS 962.96) TaxID=1314807 RepID=A0A4S8MDE9_DENBC|nr:hypothetical protein K435DRAFT_440079 [Dendrothele bispora CBS 962.96]
MTDDYLSNCKQVPPNHPFVVFHRQWWGGKELQMQRVTAGEQNFMITPSFALDGGLLKEKVRVGTTESVQLYVRDQYEDLYKFLQQTKRGAVVLGSPGIGKSVFNVYALARRLEEKQTTFYVTAHERCFIFDEKGVFELEDTNKVSLSDIKGSPWCLHDSTPRGVEPKKYFQSFFLVFTPNEARYDSILKFGFGLWYMNPWYPEELCAYFKQPLREDVYYISGPYLRDYRLCCEGLDNQWQEERIQSALRRIKEIATWDRANRSQTDPNVITHRLFALHSDDHSISGCQYTFRSEWVKKRFFETLSELKLEEAQTLFRILDQSGTTGGFIFELMQENNRKYSDPSLPAHTFKVKERKIVRYHTLHDMSFDGFNVPARAASNNPFFDAVVFEREEPDIVVWVFQVTVSTEQKTGSNQGYALLEQIREMTQQEIGSGKVAFRYVLVQPEEKFYRGPVSWQFPLDPSPKCKYDCAESNEEKHTLIPGEVYVQCLTI